MLAFAAGAITTGNHHRLAVQEAKVMTSLEALVGLLSSSNTTVVRNAVLALMRLTCPKQAGKVGATRMARWAALTRGLS